MAVTVAFEKSDLQPCSFQLRSGGCEREMARQIRLDDLAFSFPSLYAAPGVYPWNPDKLDAWASGEVKYKHDPEVDEQGLHAVRFVLSLEDAKRTWRVGAFNLTEAIELWDAPYFAAFQRWTSLNADARYPGQPAWEIAGMRSLSWIQEAVTPPADDPKQLDEPLQQRKVMVWWSVVGVFVSVLFVLFIQWMSGWKLGWGHTFPWLPTLCIALSFALFGWWRIVQARDIRDNGYREREFLLREKELSNEEHRLQEQTNASVRQMRDHQFTQTLEMAGNSMQEDVALRCAAIRQLPTYANDMSFDQRNEENPYRASVIALLLGILQESDVRKGFEDDEETLALLELLRHHTNIAFDQIRHHITDVELALWKNASFLNEEEDAPSTHI